MAISVTEKVKKRLKGNYSGILNIEKKYSICPLTDKEIISSQAQQIKLLKEKVISLEGKVTPLEKKVGYLLEQLHKLSIKKDSMNSSLAPSTDMFKKNRSLRVKSKLKSSGQLGHKGHTLKMSSKPDKTIELKSRFCSICSSNLEKEIFVLISKRQVVELPLIQPVYEEYQQYSCKCSGCGHHQTTDFPGHVSAPIQYGSSVDTIVSYLSVYQSISYNRLKKIFFSVR